MFRELAKSSKFWVVFALGVLSATPCLAAPGAGYWHTSGSKILDANNQQVRIAGINWYGFETTDEVAHGLNSQDYKTILQTIQANGYNTVRLPFSNQMVETPIVPSYVSFSNASGPDQHRPAGVEFAPDHGCDHRLCGNDRAAGHSR